MAGSAMPDVTYRVLAKLDAAEVPGGGRLSLWSVGSGGAVFFVRDRTGNNRSLAAEVGAVADCPGLPVRLEVKAVMPEAGVCYVRLLVLSDDCPDGPAAVRCCYWCHRPRAAGRVTCGDAGCADLRSGIVSADGGKS